MVLHAPSVWESLGKLRIIRSLPPYLPSPDFAGRTHTSLPGSRATAEHDRTTPLPRRAGPSRKKWDPRFCQEETTRGSHMSHRRVRQIASQTAKYAAAPKIPSANVHGTPSAKIIWLISNRTRLKQNKTTAAVDKRRIFPSNPRRRSQSSGIEPMKTSMKVHATTKWKRVP
jgi:hypothetical protein